MALEVFPGNRGDVKTAVPVLKAIAKGSYLTGDKAYDVPWFRIRLMYLGIQPSIPYRACWHEHLKVLKPGRPAENPLVCRERYKVERAFSWFCHFKRLNIRYEHLAILYKAFWQLASIQILLRRLFG